MTVFDVVLPTEYEPLTAHDRCDQGDCTAAALVRVSLDKADLVFCGHHYHTQQSRLQASDWAVVEDIRGQSG